MRLSWWKIHILTVLVLTGINIYLLMRLLRCHGDDNNKGPADGTTEPSPDEETQRRTWMRKSLVVESLKFEEEIAAVADQQELLNLNRPGRWDSSRQFVIRDFVWAGRQFQATAVNHDVCLATQSSLDRLFWLAQTADHWRGAISVAVYLVDDDESIIFQRVVNHLSRCHPDLLSSIAFHTVVSSSMATTGSSSWSASTSPATKRGAVDSESLSNNCTDSPSLDWLKSLSRGSGGLGSKWTSASRPYPQNLMRNVARKACPSRYVLLLDVDVIPSFNMAESVAAFLDNPTVALCSKCAFVVPTYELDHRSQFPHSKAELIQLEDRRLAQPFHQKAFRYNQFASNLTRSDCLGRARTISSRH